jgi:hypothetical protein
VQFGLGFVSPRVHIGMVRSFVGAPYPGSEAVSATVDRYLPLARSDVRRR